MLPRVAIKFTNSKNIQTTAGFTKHVIDMSVPVRTVSLKCYTEQLELGFALYDSKEGW